MTTKQRNISTDTVMMLISVLLRRWAEERDGARMSGNDEGPGAWDSKTGDIAMAWIMIYAIRHFSRLGSKMSYMGQTKYMTASDNGA